MLWSALMMDLEDPVEGLHVRGSVSTWHSYYNTIVYQPVIFTLV